MCVWGGVISPCALPLHHYTIKSAGIQSTISWLPFWPTINITIPSSSNSTMLILSMASSDYKKVVSRINHFLSISFGSALTSMYSWIKGTFSKMECTYHGKVFETDHHTCMLHHVLKIRCSCKMHSHCYQCILQNTKGIWNAQWCEKSG